jgi:DNA-binding CsgD family transcriptional regulator
VILDKSVVSPVFIGRQSDLQLLDRLIQQVGEKRGQIALISGEAGIGKSRLVKEARSRASEGTMLLEGQCFQTELALPYAPLLDLSRNFLASHSSEEIARALNAAAPQLVKLLPELALHFPHLASIPNPDPRQEKRSLFQAFEQAIIGLAQSQSLFLVMEDLHWSDSTSLEFLLQLARRIPSQRILMLLTYRSDETTPELTHFLAGLDRERLGVEFALQHMGQTDVDAMLRATLELTSPISQEFLDTILPLTEGNPFFIEEVLKSLIADGDIFYADGTWDRKEINQLRIPRTVQDAVQRRTQKLDGPTLHALTLAAVMGRRFDFSLLQGLLGVDEDELTTMIKDLVNAQLVVEESIEHFAFRHALTREAIYSTLLMRERQSLHRQVAEAIERIYADSISSHLADLSYHYFTSSQWQKALDYSRQASQQARTLYAQREAIVYCTRALTAARELGIAIPPEMLGNRGHAYEILGDFKSALEDFEEALKLAREQHNGHAEWQTLIDLGFLWAGRDYQRTGDYFRHAEELARDLGDSKLHAQSLNRLGNWSVNVGQTAEGLESHRRALEIFENDNDEKGMADTRDLLGMATLQHGDQIGCFDEYQHAIPLYRKLNDKHGLVSALMGACHASYDETDLMPPQSRAEQASMAMEALELARQIGWAADQALAEWSMAIGLSNRGLFEEAITHAKSALRIASEIEHRQWMTGAFYALGHTYVLMLQADLAIQSLEQGLAFANELGSAWWIGNITSDLANAYLLKQNLDGARSLLESVSQNQSGHLSMAQRRMLLAKGKLHLAENKPDQALSIAQGLLDSRESTQPIPALLKLKGEALVALKQPKEAAQALEGARLGAQMREDLPNLWQINARQGWLHKSQKELEWSEREFANARQVLHTLQMNIQDEALRESFVRKVNEYLPKEKIVSKRQSESDQFGGLTPRERDVAHFLAQGKSNREIAEKLVLSERTVENHVGNILTKLGFDSRSQIAVWAMEKGLGEKPDLSQSN